MWALTASGAQPNLHPEEVARGGAGARVGVLGQPPASEVSLQGQGDGSRPGLGAEEGLSAREEPAWVVSGLGLIWSWGGQMPSGCQRPGLSPEGQPGPGVVQPLQRAQVVG